MLPLDVLELVHPMAADATSTLRQTARTALGMFRIFRRFPGCFALATRLHGHTLRGRHVEKVVRPRPEVWAPW